MHDQGLDIINSKMSQISLKQKQKYIDLKDNDQIEYEYQQKRQMEMSIESNSHLKLSIQQTKLKPRQLLQRIKLTDSSGAASQRSKLAFLLTSSLKTPAHPRGIHLTLLQNLPSSKISTDKNFRLFKNPIPKSLHTCQSLSNASHLSEFCDCLLHLDQPCLQSQCSADCIIRKSQFLPGQRRGFDIRKTGSIFLSNQRLPKQQNNSRFQTRNQGRHCQTQNLRECLLPVSQPFVDDGKMPIHMLKARVDHRRDNRPTPAEDIVKCICKNCDCSNNNCKCRKTNKKCGSHCQCDQYRCRNYQTLYQNNQNQKSTLQSNPIGPYLESKYQKQKMLQSMQFEPPQFNL